MNENKSLEELAKDLEQAKQAYEFIQHCYNTKAKEEAEARKAQLAAEKEARHKAVEDAYDIYLELRRAYVKDYGSYVTMRTCNDPDFSDLRHWVY